MARLRLFRHASILLLLLGCCFPGPLRAQSAGVMPWIDPQFFDSNGNPLSGGTLTFYAAGTTTLVQVFSDSTKITVLPNPLTLDSTGRTSTQVFFGAASYKIVVKDVNGVTIRTADNVTDMAYLAQLSTQPSEQTTTLNGTVNDFALNGSALGSAFTYSTLVLRCNNASSLFITGFTAGTGGQRLIVLSVGGGDVFLSHQSLGSLAQNRMINLQTVELTPLRAGTGLAEFVYDDQTLRWRMIRAEIGGFGTYTPTWTGSVTNPAIGNGVLTGRYVINGRVAYVDIRLMIGSTTTMGSGFWTFSLPLLAVDTTSQVGGSAMVLNNTVRYWHLIPLLNTTGKILLNMIDASAGQASATIPMTWTTNDSASISMWYFLQ